MNGLSTVESLLQLRSLNVTLSAAGDRLRCSAPRGVMTADLQEQLATRKTGILEFLKGDCLATRPQPLAIALNATSTVETAWGTADCLR
jgi:hypothetical protein